MKTLRWTWFLVRFLFVYVPRIVYSIFCESDSGSNTITVKKYEVEKGE